MKLRQRVERFYSVWRFDGPSGHWTPHFDGITSKREARELLRSYVGMNSASERYCLVETVPTRIDAGGK